MKYHKEHRAAFSIMELIFVILIIGVLGIVAIPRLAAMRGNASLAKDVSDMATCIRDANTYVLGSGDHFDINDSNACPAVRCYDINISNSLLTVKINDNNPPGYCSGIMELGSHLVGTHKLKGHSAKF
jgi:type II secretory pathway pseudopilin PulG